GRTTPARKTCRWRPECRPGGRGQNVLMRIKLIEDLPMATSAELYQLSWVIEQLLADPRRIVQVRAQLHTGQQIQYLSWHDGKLRPARVVGIHGDHVAVLDAAFNKAFKVHYAAIITDAAAAPTERGATPTSVELTSQVRHPRFPVVPTSASATASPSSTR